MLGTRTYLHVCIAHHGGHVAATIDAIDSADGKRSISASGMLCYCIGYQTVSVIKGVTLTSSVLTFVITRIGILGRHFSVCHVHVDMRIAHHFCIITFTATIDRTNLRCRDYKHLRIIVGKSDEACCKEGCRLCFFRCRSFNSFVICRLKLCLGTWRAIVVIAIDRICCIIATAIELVDDDGLATRLLHHDGDRAIDLSNFFVTAKHLTEVTIGDSQRNVAVHVGSPRASVLFFGIVDALHRHAHIAVDLGILTGTVGLV